MTYPFTGTYPITTKFGVYDPVAYANYPGSKHPGVDFGMPINTTLLAAQDGTVTVFDRDPNIKTGRGKEVSIQLGGTLANTCHMNKILVHNGQDIKQGQIIGYSGNTGFSSGPHTHFETVVNGQYVDPISVIEESTVNPTYQEVLDNFQAYLGRPCTEDEQNRFVAQDFREMYRYILENQAPNWPFLRDAHEAGEQQYVPVGELFVKKG